eukprot:5795416-Pyramimonas_sp.AAC.1
MPDIVFQKRSENNLIADEQRRAALTQLAPLRKIEVAGLDRARAGRSFTRRAAGPARAHERGNPQGHCRRGGESVGPSTDGPGVGD